MPATLSPEAVEKTIADALPQFGVDPDRIAPEASFEDLDVDSLDIAELSQVIEEQHGVRLKGEDVVKIKTIADAVGVVIARAA